MLRLIRGSGARIGEEIRLSLPATIGRHPRATVVIRDTRSSRYHARIVPHGRGARLEDLDSRNGTFLNGARIRNAPLAHGDSIRIGETVLILVDERGREWVGRSIGEFEITSRTDRFLLSTQYLARQPSMSREVSLILLDDDLDETERTAAIAAARRSGRIRSSAALRVFDIVEAEGRTLVIAEPPAGVPLEEVLDGPLEKRPRFLADLGARLADLAARAEAAGVSLGGLDPRLIYLGEGGDIKVANAGMGEGLSRARHLSPEEREGKPPTPASDVYAIGSLLATAAEGTGAVEEVLSQAMSEDPGRRQTSPEDLAADLRKARSAPVRRAGQGPGAVPGTAEEPPPPLGAGVRFVRGVAFLILLASLFFLSSQVVRLILSR